MSIGNVVTLGFGPGASGVSFIPTFGFSAGAAVSGGGGSSGTARTLTLPIGYWDRDLEYVAGKPDQPVTRQHSGNGILSAMFGSGVSKSLWQVILKRYKGNGQLPPLFGQGSYALDERPMMREYISGGGLLTESDPRLIRHYEGTGNGKSKKRIRREILELIDPDLARLLK